VDKTLVLASRSPRRLRLLRQINIIPVVQPCDVDETLDPAQTPAANAERLATRKAEVSAGAVANGIVLGADTIVSIDGVMLGKPADTADAESMLSLLSGRTHIVHTGYALIDCPTGTRVTGVEETEVTFRELSAAEIRAYVRSGSPMDKAGSYGIQDDFGAVFVRRINGCYYTVVGLPLQAVYAALAALDQKILAISEEKR
jgi:septum formation protein